MKIKLVKVLRSVCMETSELASGLRRMYKYFQTQVEQVKAVMVVCAALLEEN